MSIKATVQVTRHETILLPTSSFEEARTLAHEHNFGDGSSVTGCISMELTDESRPPYLVTTVTEDSISTSGEVHRVVARSAIEAAFRAGLSLGRRQMPGHVVRTVSVKQAH
jgi:hypothetical protein